MDEETNVGSEETSARPEESAPVTPDASESAGDRREPTAEEAEETEPTADDTEEAEAEPDSNDSEKAEPQPESEEAEGPEPAGDRVEDAEARADGAEADARPTEPIPPLAGPSEAAAAAAAVPPTQTTAPKGGRHRVRRVATVVLVILTAVFTLGSVIGVWVHRSIYNESEFTAIVTPVSEDPQVIDPLATYLTVQALQALDLQGRVDNTLQAIGSVLPGDVGSRLGALAAPLTNAAQQFVQGKVQEFLQSDTFRQLFNKLVVGVHEKLVALIKGDYSQLPNLEVSGATVYLNTIPIIGEILRHVVQSAADLVGLNVTIPELGSVLPDQARQLLGKALGVSLPENFGQVPIMSSEKLHQYQAAAKTFGNLVVLMIVLAVVCFALAVVLSVRRRRTLIALGLAITGTLLLAGILLRTIIDNVVAGIQKPGAKSAAQDVVTIMGHNLREVGAIVLWPAIALAVIAYMAGKPRWLMTVGRATRRVSIEDREGGGLARFVAERYEVLVAAACGIALVLFAIFGIHWLSLVLIGVLLAATIWWLTTLRTGERARAGEPAAA